MTTIKIKDSKDLLVRLGLPLRTKKGNPTRPTFKTIVARAKKLGFELRFEPESERK